MPFGHLDAISEWTEVVVVGGESKPPHPLGVFALQGSNRAKTVTMWKGKPTFLLNIDEVMVYGLSDHCVVGLNNRLLSEDK